MTQEVEAIHDILESLNLPKGQWVMAGSGVMALHGINPRPVGDIDIFLATRTWFDLYNRWLTWNIFTTDPDDPLRRCDPPYLYKTLFGIPVNIFFEWRTRDKANADVNKMIASAQTVKGWPCVPLQYILDVKRELVREKDKPDIEALEQHLEAK